MKYVLFFLMLFPSLALAQPVADYYVDGLHGSNTNPGTSSGLPFLTLGAAEAVIGANQTLAVYGGASVITPIKYREQFTTPASGITIIGWGSAKPDFDCSDVIASGSFTQTPGYAHIWQVTITTANILGFIRAWEDNRAMIRAGSLAILDSKSGQFHTSGNPQGNGIISFILYIHPIASDDPTSNGKAYEFNKRGYGLLSPTNANVLNIRTLRNLCNNGSIEVGSGSYVSGVAADDGHKHNALAHQGSTWEDVTMTNSYYGQNRIALVLNDNIGDGVSTTIFRRITYVETLEANGTGFFGHVNVSGKFGPVILEDCITAGKVYTAVSSFASTSLTITGGTFVGNVVLASDNNLLEYATINGSQVQVPYSKPVEISHVTIQGSATSGPGLVRVTFNPVLNIHHCVFTVVISYDGAIYFNNTSAATLTLLNNTFFAPVPVSHLNGLGTANLSLSSVIDGNVYHHPVGGPSWVQLGGTTYNISIPAQWAAWRSHGFDTTGSVVSP